MTSSQRKNNWLTETKPDELIGFTQLRLPPCELRVSKGKDSEPSKVWDPIRGCWLVLTREEWVRRHVIGLLTGAMGVTPQLISQEYPIPIQGMHQRADIVVFGADGKPLMLVECKAPEIGIDARVYAQAVRYNSVLGARYVMITNGLQHYLFEKGSSDKYTLLKSLPDLA